MDYASVARHRSKVFHGVSFAVRKPSLAQRIELTTRVRELTSRHEFLNAGDAGDQLTAALSELFVTRLYLEWGLVEVDGLLIDGEQATPERIVEFGPEELVQEIVGDS